MEITEYPLTSSHLKFAHEEWKIFLKEPCRVIDATCGNGRDTLKLAQLIDEKSSVIALDIQAKAIAQTERLLSENLTIEQRGRVHLFCQSHIQFPKLAHEKPVQLVVYNLGYLPGGDKNLTTITETTLLSLKEAMTLLHPGGLISITCYPGHLEGQWEQSALLQMLQDLPLSNWLIRFYRKALSETAPSLLFIHKTTHG